MSNASKDLEREKELDVDVDVDVNEQWWSKIDATFALH